MPASYSDVAAVSSPTPSTSRVARRESILLIACVLFGFTALPAAIFVVGRSIFGDYGGGYIGDFFSSLIGDVLSFDPVVWFLVLSPYVVIQGTRATVRAFRLLRR